MWPGDAHSWFHPVDEVKQGIPHMGDLLSDEMILPLVVVRDR